MSLPVVTAGAALPSGNTPMLLAVVVAVFVWWFSTGVVLLLDGLPRRTYRWSLAAGSLVAIGALMAMPLVAARTDPAPPMPRSAVPSWSGAGRNWHS